MICYEKDGVQMIVNENMVRVMESCGYKRVVEKTAPSSVQIPDWCRQSRQIRVMPIWASLKQGKNSIRDRRLPE